VTEHAGDTRQKNISKRIFRRFLSYQPGVGSLSLRWSPQIFEGEVHNGYLGRSEDSFKNCFVILFGIYEVVCPQKSSTFFSNLATLAL
jgi:hypothetical protein